MNWLAAKSFAAPFRTDDLNTMFPQASKAVAISSRRFARPLASTPSLLSRQKTSAPPAPPAAAPRTRHVPDPFGDQPGHHGPVPALTRQRHEPPAAPPARILRADTFRAAVAAKDHGRLLGLFWEMAKQNPALLSSLTAGGEARVQALDAVLRVVDKTRAAGGSAGFGDADTRRAMLRVCEQGPCEPARLRRVVEELEVMCGGMQVVDRETRITIMRAFSCVGDFGEAARRFRDLIGEREGIGFRNALLDALCRTNAEATIIATFESIKASGTPPDLETYRHVVGFYMRRRQHDRVVELWDECIARGIDQANAVRAMGVNAALAMLEVGKTDQFDSIVGVVVQDKESGDLRGLPIIAAERLGNVEQVWNLLPEPLEGRRVAPAAWRALARVVGPISAPSVLTSESDETETAITARESIERRRRA
ncbi:hypothetical protein BDK51DRAFT_49711 [Blyttiomyces helicus]|uniref:Pentacotripeptide-repeat region of PRORP domain-containing protein n=1 Tax=Blyttiomyces helicus TaxID=388810 RepID=A0A4P9WID8_9FUNG|nr:hypothetical protein BDK51DRAFT_49711 [Blyttiomyces helicus]|eukprot:RKO92182.1 hypothetical protein BDK51DRAFT_49711 [Blyttiomyces helicus]